MLYDLALLLGSLIALPKWLTKKKYRGTLAQKFGLISPPLSTRKPTIWIHMVSLGETKVMTSTYHFLKEKYPDAAFYLSSTTKTGHEEAKRSLPAATSYFYLPLDLSWIVRKWVALIKPDYFILSESDFWPNLLSEIKKRGGKTFLLNGKISEKSAKRFSYFPFARKVFSSIDHFYVQNESYAKAFMNLSVPPSKITSIGNLKLTIPFQPLSEEEKTYWRGKWGLKRHDKVVTLASTHDGEESLILPHLREGKILIAPRHPERLPTLKKILQSNPRYILIEEMGILSVCYQLSHVAIVGGSFLPGVGGHNIFEPIQAQIPVLFGPFMESQKELTALILSSKAGIQTPIEDLPRALVASQGLTTNVKNLLQRTEENKTTFFEQFSKQLSCP